MIMSDITRKVGGIRVTRHYEGNWSIGEPDCVRLLDLHALQIAPILEKHFGVPLAEARQATIEIMHEARRTPALV
jgi:hypothetical protein